MKEYDNNPLGLENKLYNIEVFGSALRKKFGGDERTKTQINAAIKLVFFMDLVCFRN